MTADAARVGALGALYAADARSLEHIDITKVSARSATLAEGAWDHKDVIDATITAASTRWRLERMPAVDRNILRLGTYELLFTDVPFAVVIDEYVELAKEYSTANSGAFVNGVLSAVVDARDRSETTDM